MFKTPNKILVLNLFVLLMQFSLQGMTAETYQPSILDKATLIQSFTLTQAIEFAVSNNPDLQIASERIAQAEANLGVALSVFYPEISAKVGYEDSNNPSHVFSMLVSQRQYGTNQNINNPGYYQDFRPEITGKLSLFRGGQDYQNSKAAELGISAAEYELSSIRNALIQAVTTSYYVYLGALEAHKVAQESIWALDSELTQTRKQFLAGTVLKADVLSLEVKSAEAKDAEIRAGHGIELAQLGIANLLGLSTDQPFSVASETLLTKPVLSASFKDLLDQALLQRPELKAAANQVEIRQHQLLSEQGAYLPKADAYVSYGQDSRTLGFSSQKENVTAGVTVEMALFSGLQTQNRVSSAQRKVAEAIELERKTKLAIEQEVKTALIKLDEALARIRVTETSVTAANEVLRLVNEQRRAETVTVTRYIEAEVARNKARANIIAAHYDALSAEAALKKALGDWK